MEKRRFQVMLAVAVAVVKSRAAGMSGRQHVEALAGRLRGQEDTCRSQDDLRKLITMMTAGGDAAMSTFLKDPSSPASSPSDTPKLFQPAFLSNQHKDAQRRVAGLPHMHLLQSLCTLSRMGAGPDSLWCGPGENVGLVLDDTLCQLLDSVVAVFRDPCPGGMGELALKACRAWARASDRFCSQNAPCGDLRARVHMSLKELTAILLHANQRHSTCEMLTACLVALASSSMSKSFLVAHFLCEISALADVLWHALQEKSPLDVFPVDQYQNSGRLLWILEELLQNSEVAWREKAQFEWMDSLLHLQRRMFALSEEFPLFAISTWRIAALLA
ncbi:meiosis-specific protein MEI4-like [Dunckerocampus dactyliophorus]|uniref:meiosis-specific protein MEI4-like n=1 Tax=Dunckerocampus dactyliophorus TaxID=161453 RepID=UPI002406EC7B|nr:meiosis-specific protein MEI4-like [Dunckerocampus dactyliophorus]